MKYFVSNQPEKLFSFLDNVLVAVGHLFYLLERFSQHVRDITGDHALFGVVDCSQVAGCPVQENSGNGSGFGLQPFSFMAIWVPSPQSIKRLLPLKRTIREVSHL